MATNPKPYRLPQEELYVDDLYEDDPELDAWLDEQERLLERGELKLHEHSEVVARLRQLGVPLDDEPADFEPQR